MKGLVDERVHVRNDTSSVPEQTSRCNMHQAILVKLWKNVNHDHVIVGKAQAKECMLVCITTKNQMMRVLIMKHQKERKQMW